MTELTLKAKIEGPAVADGQIEFRRLISFGDTFQKLLDQVAIVHLAEQDRFGDAKPPRQDTALRIIAMQPGSFDLALRLQPSEGPTFFNIGPEAVELLFSGIEAIRDEIEQLPKGYNQVVLGLWRELGTQLLKDGIERIDFEFQSPTATRQLTYDQNLQEKVISYIQSPRTKKLVLKGRFMIVNFNPDSRSVRLYVDEGGFVRCTFDGEITPIVQEALRHHCRVWGTSYMDPTSEKIEELKIKGVTILRRVEDGDEALLSLGDDSQDDIVEFATSEELDEISKYLFEKNYSLHRRLAK